MELLRFYQNLLQDIRATQLSEEEGGNTEQIFTQIAVDLLVSAGETENVRLAYDKKGVGTKNQHQINAYSISDNYETLDLFITILKGTDEPARTTSAETETAQKRILNFFRKAVYKDYVNEIEESSDIFQLANELASSQELRENLIRVNAIILTDGIFSNELPKSDSISGFSVYTRIVDLNYLYNITEKSHIPIELDFKADGFEIPCIESPSENDNYKSYLAIIPGTALANIYERFGSRLLEQNVRSFLQFTGKINKGIRNTILKEPQMFLAFNNGIAATANHIELERDSKGKGLIISKVNDLQIVNGGQTTASIYHTFKKDKADVSNIFVQVKLSVVKNSENFGEIVSRIAEYANTQNKISIADLSSNRPYHIHFEKLSRAIVTPHSEKNPTQTKWFYERARGQYKNARLKEGFTRSRQKAFDLKHPRSQMFTKEQLAKYINSYQEVYEGKKLVIAPHFVIKNVKNYNQFILYNTNIKIEHDNIYYEDTIAKSILYKACEKLYGIKPNAIGDLRFITVPYSITYFGYKTNYKLDLYKIWKNQDISDNLRNFLYNLMVKMDVFLKANSPESLIEMWARKEACWELVKQQDFDLDYHSIKDDFINEKIVSNRKQMSEDEVIENEKIQKIEVIKSVPSIIWRKIENWGRETDNMSLNLQNIANSISKRLKSNSQLPDREIANGLIIIDRVLEIAPEILAEVDNLSEDIVPVKEKQSEITLELIQKIVNWDKKNRYLRSFEYVFMNDLAEGKKTLTERNKIIALLNLNKAKKGGFKE
ncbi:AIPR family protein [Chryseobacterium lathyri]|uniref:AIPR family protein n=1 Tax=Chryseobacterium lathyri TaxID=395933 RepID=UPI00358F5127